MARTTNHVQSERSQQVRDFQPSDLTGFLDLYEAVWGRSKSEAWFRWRFEANPYADGVEMVVSERDGELVGVEPCLPFELRVDTGTIPVLQPADWLVHPDHRRQGVFTEMTERLLERYVGSRYELYYNFPTPALRPGLDTFDWNVVGEQPTYYRVQHPKSLVEKKETGNATPILAGLATPVARAFLGVRDRLAATADGIEVERYGEVPSKVFTVLYELSVPSRLHVARDEAFYDWRFENPDWETTAYVTWSDGEPIAGVVTCREETCGVTATRIVDVQPMARAAQDDTALNALLGAAVEDNRDVDVLCVADSSMPDTVLSTWGFLRDDTVPLSTIATTTMHVVRSTATAGDAPMTLGGQDPTNPDHWALSLAGQDIA